MNLPKVTISQNGHKASPSSGEAFPVEKQPLPSETLTNGSSTEHVARLRAQRTTFPDDPQKASLRTLLYGISRHYLGGAPLFRWLLWALFIVSAIWFTGLLGLRWIGGSVFLLIALLSMVLLRRWRKRDFVTFTEQPQPDVSPEPMDSQERVLIHATGYFGVEGKNQRYTWLPGYYRSFATREHALLCMVKDRQFWRVARWLPEEVGMWYAFFSPGVIDRVRWGQLRFGQEPRLAVAVDCRVTMPPRNRFQREKIVIETLYLAVQSEEDGRRILADLLHDAPQPDPDATHNSTS